MHKAPCTGSKETAAVITVRADECRGPEMPSNLPKAPRQAGSGTGLLPGFRLFIFPLFLAAVGFGTKQAEQP